MKKEQAMWFYIKETNTEISFNTDDCYIKYISPDPEAGAICNNKIKHAA
jgi:hypothetical protein